MQRDSVFKPLFGPVTDGIVVHVSALLNKLWSEEFSSISNSKNQKRSNGLYLDKMKISCNENENYFGNDGKILLNGMINYHQQKAKPPTNKLREKRLIIDGAGIEKRITSHITTHDKPRTNKNLNRRHKKKSTLKEAKKLLNVRNINQASNYKMLKGWNLSKFLSLKTNISSKQKDISKHKKRAHSKHQISDLNPAFSQTDPNVDLMVGLSSIEMISHFLVTIFKPQIRNKRISYLKKLTSNNAFKKLERIKSDVMMEGSIYNSNKKRTACKSSSGYQENEVSNFGDDFLMSRQRILKDPNEYKKLFKSEINSRRHTKIKRNYILDMKPSTSSFLLPSSKVNSQISNSLPSSSSSSPPFSFSFSPPLSNLTTALSSTKHTLYFTHSNHTKSTSESLPGTRSILYYPLSLRKNLLSIIISYIRATFVFHRKLIYDTLAYNYNDWSNQGVSVSTCKQIFHFLSDALSYYIASQTVASHASNIVEDGTTSRRSGRFSRKIMKRQFKVPPYDEVSKEKHHNNWHKATDRSSKIKKSTIKGKTYFYDLLRLSNGEQIWKYDDLPHNQTNFSHHDANCDHFHWLHLSHLSYFMGHPGFGKSVDGVIGWSSLAFLHKTSQKNSNYNQKDVRQGNSAYEIWFRNSTMIYDGGVNEDGKVLTPVSSNIDLPAINTHQIYNDFAINTNCFSIKLSSSQPAFFKSRHSYTHFNIDDLRTAAFLRIYIGSFISHG